jgi:hypothetical protein
MGFENGHLVRVAMRAVHVAGQEQVNVLHYDLQDVLVGTDNDPQALADRLADDLIAPYAALFDPGWTVQPVEVVEERDPQNPLAPRSAWTAGAATTGTKTAPVESLPMGITAVATLRTNHIGRRYRGRLFLGGTVLENEQSAGIIGSGLATLYNAFLDAIPREPDIATGESDATARWVVYSKTQRAADLDPYASPVTAAVLRPTLHFLRSRA